KRYFCSGGMSERFNEAVLLTESCGKTVDPKGPGVRILRHKLSVPEAFLFMHFTYILKSIKDSGYYYAHCENLDIRLKRHNQGKGSQHQRP
ncbi:MAG: hypothetical protein ABJA79_03390, partial [Parafilimonas sp.]